MIKINDKISKGNQNFDIFISYKTRKYAKDAAWVATCLSSIGYNVWFDKTTLDRKEETIVKRSKDELIEILQNAARSCKCSVIFEAELDKVMLLPGMTEEYAVENRLVMKTEGGIVAWNWQKVEIDASSKIIGIYASSYTVSVNDNGKDITRQIGIPVEPYVNTSILLQRILQALEYFGIMPSKSGQDPNNKL